MILLPRRPSAAAAKRALKLAGDDDLLAVEAAELHWLPRAGILQSGFDTKARDELLGAGTTRTLGTVAQMAAKFFAA